MIFDDPRVILLTFKVNENNFSTSDDTKRILTYHWRETEKLMEKRAANRKPPMFSRLYRKPQAIFKTEKPLKKSSALD